MSIIEMIEILAGVAVLMVVAGILGMRLAKHNNEH